MSRKFFTCGLAAANNAASSPKVLTVRGGGFVCLPSIRYCPGATSFVKHLKPDKPDCGYG